jgi:hypothetical protein
METLTIGKIQFVEAKDGLEAVKIGRKHGKTFRIIAHSQGMIDSIKYNGDWKYVPFEMDDSVIPTEALKRAKLLESRGMVMGKIVAHETPLNPKTHEERELEKNKGTAILTGLAAIGAVVGLVGLTVLTASLYMVDPALICVLRDGTWIEVCNWDEGYA